MKRRYFVQFLAGAAATWPVAAVGQQPARLPTVAVLSDEHPDAPTKSFEYFAGGLRDAGYIEGKNVAFERRYGLGKDEVLPALAGELVGLRPDVIFSVGTPATRAAKAATTAIPIVFARIGDPVGLGIVSSLSRPGGNVTGVTILTNDTEGKRLELLIALAPDAKRVAMLWDSTFPPARAELRETERAAKVLNLEAIVVDAHARDDLPAAIASMVDQRVGAVIVVPGLIFTEQVQYLVDLLNGAHLPAMFYRKEHVIAGGLISYRTDYPAMYRQAAALTVKILNRTKPADIPVEQPTRLDLAVNRRTARSLGLNVPAAVLVQADEVIE